MQLRGRCFDTQQPILLECEGARISAIRPLSDAADDLPWIAPGLIDLQVNGFGGQDFNDRQLTVEKVLRVCRALDPLGVTRCCPTVTTADYGLLAHALTTIAQAHDDSPEVQRRMAGIHLEGPYLSPEDGPRGAHPREHCRPPDWDEFQRLQEAARGHIRILTMAPEYDGAAAFIERVVASGVRVAIGHTAADSQQVQNAVNAGATLSTHLGNGAHAQIRRHPNYIWDQLAEDRLMASLIVDGHHLPAAVVKTFVRAKTPQRCILVSDITGMAGMPPGRYEQSSLGAVEVLEDGRLVIAGQRQLLAGASLPLTMGVANIVRFTELDLRQAIEMASTRPAALVDCPVGQLRVGAPADLVQFRIPLASAQPLEILSTINQGELVYSGPPGTPAP